MGCNCGNSISQRTILPEFSSNGCPDVPKHDLFTSYTAAEKQIIAEQLGFLVDTINITNNPDEEDLTSVAGENSTVLKFKDKEYDPTNFSGYGRIFLRKNLKQISDVTNSNYTTHTINTLTQSMFESESGCPLINTIFIVQYEYDLNGSCIELPEDSMLLFLGGSITNGSIILHNTYIINNFLDFDTVFQGITFKNNFKVGTTRLVNNTLYYFYGNKWLALSVEGTKSCVTEYSFYYGTAKSSQDILTSKSIKSFKSTLDYIKPVRFTEPEASGGTVPLHPNYFWVLPDITGYFISIYINGVLLKNITPVDTLQINGMTYKVYSVGNLDDTEFDSQVIYMKK